MKSTDGEIGMRATTVRGLVAVALAAAAMTGCSAEPVADKRPVDTVRVELPSTPPASDSPTGVAAKGGTVGGSDSACALPVTFDLAERWKPEAVSDGVAKKGIVSLACEIDAKPAGNIGYLRVWTANDAGGATPREVLEGFVAEHSNAENVRYSQTTAGEFTAVEARYVLNSEVLGSRNKRALALTTSGSAVVVSLDGLDSQEQKQMLPAYELAKRSLRPS